jgi:hypothetical protein
MTRRYTGGFLSAKEQATDANTANGIFTVQEAGALTAAGSFPTGRWTPQRSVRLRNSASAWLSRVPSVASGNSQWTYSAWLKIDPSVTTHIISANGNSSGSRSEQTFSISNGQFAAYGFNNGSGYGWNKFSNELFRDPSAWYHFVIWFDADNSDSTKRVRTWVNNKELTWASTADSGAGGNWSNFRHINNTGIYSMAIGAGWQTGGAPAYFTDNYVSEAYMVSSSLITPVAFAMTDPETGTWVPKRYTGTYGTNGFYLDFRDNTAATASTLGADRSGNGNNWTPNNITVSGVLSTTLSYTTVGSSTFTPPANVTSVSYLVVAGGGGGGSYAYPGGGGAGGVLYGTQTVVPGTVYNITVGGGGAGGIYPSTYNGSNGSNSTFGSLTAVGGGYGASSATTGGNGGSGGGGKGNASTNLGGTGTSGQGSNGGTGGSDGATWANGGGGGGATAVGGNATSGAAGNGGAGYTWPVTSTTYGGGGGGGGTGSEGSGGSGGGGAGSEGGGANGTANTGGGGGAAGGVSTNNGGTGGSGIVILSYSIADSTYDSMVDVPGIANASSQQDFGGVTRGNYCTINPVANTNNTTSNGNLSISTGGNYSAFYSTMAVNTGKWYFEITKGSTGDMAFGLFQKAGNPNNENQMGIGPDSMGCYLYYNQGAGLGSTSSGDNRIQYNGGHYGAPVGFGNDDTGTVYGVYLDFDNSVFTLVRANDWVNRLYWTMPTALTSAPLMIGYSVKTSWPATTMTFNFGQRPFLYAPQAGFKTLCTTNLPTPVIKRPSDHFDAKAYTGNGTSLQIGNSQKQSSGYAINKSLKFNTSSSYLQTQFPTAGNRKTFTISCWFKRNKVDGNAHFLFEGGSVDSYNGRFAVRIDGGDTLTVMSGTNYFLITSALFKDLDLWHHLVVAVNTTNYADAQRVRLYLDGKEVTSFGTRTNPSANDDLGWNSAGHHSIGYCHIDKTGAWGGYIAETYSIDGQALTPSEFGQFDANNNWVPKPYTGTYGTNGFYLPYNAPSSTSSYAAYFNGSSAYLTAPSSANYTLGSTGDFTVDGWFYFTGSSITGIYPFVTNYNHWDTGYTNRFWIGISDSKFRWYGSNGNTRISCPPPPNNTWNFFRFVRSGSTIYGYLNGGLIGTQTIDLDYTTNDTLRLGGSMGNGSYFTGYLSNIRIIKGTALSNTVPTSTSTAVSGTSFLGLTTSSVTTDSSTNNATITNSAVLSPITAYPFAVAPSYSTFFNGTSAYLTWPGNMTIGTGNFTAEGWFYFTGFPNANGGSGATIFRHAPADRTVDFFVEAYRLKLYCPTVGIDSYLGAETLTTNRWYHLALVKSSNTFTAYINGVACSTPRTGSGSSIGNMATLATGTGDNYTQGYVANFRVVNGTAVYTGNFTPPLTVAATQSAGTNIAAISSGTNILTCNGPTIIDSSSNAWTITNVAVQPSVRNTILPTSTGVGADSSGNARNFGIVNIDQLGGLSPTYDSVYDSPTDVIDSNGNYVGDYATINHTYNGVSVDVTNANLTATFPATGGWTSAVMGGAMPTTGKWFWQGTLQYVGGGTDRAGIGFVNVKAGAVPSASYPSGGNSANWMSFYSHTSGFYYNSTAYSYGTTYSTGDTIGIAYDADNQKVWVCKNGTWLASGDPVAGTNGFAPPVDLRNGWSPVFEGWTGTIWNINFGQQPLGYAVPTGFRTLNTKSFKETGSSNLPDSFGNYVNTPDLVILKARDNSGYRWQWLDTVRGPKNIIFSSDTDAEASYQSVQEFLPNGITLGTEVGVNAAGGQNVGYFWNRGKTPGFDIVNYSGNGTGGRIVQHNLGAIPSMIITKNLSASSTNWGVYHKGIGTLSNTTVLYLNDTGALGSFTANLWNSTQPGTDYFTVGDTTINNGAAARYIAYLWTDVPGFSKFGTYVSNNSNDGPFIHTGFRPRWIMVKSLSFTNSETNWVVWDADRTSYNGLGLQLFLNKTWVEGRRDDNASALAEPVDFLSNGFKLRSSFWSNNGGSGNTFLYAAFAETPFKYANAR